MQCCRIVNGIKNKNIKNSLGAMWNASHLAPRIKTNRRFTAKKPRWLNDFLEGGCINTTKRFLMVGTRYFASAPNDWYSMWYHYYERTWSITSLPGLVFRRKRAVFILLAMPPTSLGRAALVMWCGWFKPLLEIRHAAALTTGAKHWHRQKAVFYVFVSVPPQFLPLKPKKSVIIGWQWVT